MKNIIYINLIKKMIEVNLFSLASTDPTTMVGRCVARSRFNKETLGVSIMEFVKGFLKDNLDTLESGIGNADLVSLINSDTIGFSTKDFMSIQYCLNQIGYKVTIWNVADDEENALGVPSGDVIEWNIIDSTFIQNDYPTTTKLMPSTDKSLADILRQVVEQCGLFNPEKFDGVKNPFTPLLGNLDKEKNVTGHINSSIVTQIYGLLSQMGINIFCATSED